MGKTEKFKKAAKHHQISEGGNSQEIKTRLSKRDADLNGVNAQSPSQPRILRKVVKSKCLLDKGKDKNRLGKVKEKISEGISKAVNLPQRVSSAGWPKGPN